MDSDIRKCVLHNWNSYGNLDPEVEGSSKLVHETNKFAVCGRMKDLMNKFPRLEIELISKLQIAQQRKH